MKDRFPSDRIARFTLLGVVGLLGIGLGRVAQLQFAPADELIDHRGRRTQTDKQLHWRGDIRDREGRILAMSTLGYTLAVDPKFLGDGLEKAGLLPKPGDDDDPAEFRLRPEYQTAWQARLRQVADVLAEGLGLDRELIRRKLQRKVGKTETLAPVSRTSRYCILATEVDPDDRDHPGIIRRLALEVPGAETKPWRIQGLVLDERPIRKVIEDESLASLIGDVGAVNWYPPPNEYDRIPSRLRVDVARFLDWAATHEPEIDDPLARLGTGIAEALFELSNGETSDTERRESGIRELADGITRQLEISEADGVWAPAFPPELLQSSHRRMLREITIGDPTVDEQGNEVPPRSITRDLVLEFTDLEALEVLRSRYPDQVGTSGVEWERNQALRQRHGRLERTVAVKGDTLYLESFERGHDGDHVKLTVDANIQLKVRRRLEQAIEDHQAVGGWAVVADPRTGEILAAVDIFDNEEAQDRKGWVGGMLDPRRDSFGPAHGRNRIWTDTYEPGSTFKTLFWAWSRELDRVGGDEEIDIGSNNGKTFGKRRIEYIGRDKGPTPWRTCLLKSINTGFATVAQRVTNKEMVEMCVRFGIGAPTGLEMGVDRRQPGRSLGTSPGMSLLKSSKTGERLSMSFGYSVSLTPLQLVRAYCAIARNDGRLPDMTLIGPVAPEFGSSTFPVTVRPEIALETRGVLQEQFEKVRDRVEQNGGKPISWTAFGKSGTAYLPRGDEEGNQVGYHKAPLPPRYLSSYVAGAPFDDPRIVVAVGIQDPLPGEAANAEISYAGQFTGHLGSYAAGRPAHDIIGEVLEELGVPADRESLDDQPPG